jgi:hypothetical protein
MCDGDFKDSINEQPGSSSVVQGVAESINGIGYSGIGYSTSGVRAIAVGNPPVEPSGETAADGSYPLARFLYVTVNKHPNRAEPAGARVHAPGALQAGPGSGRTRWLHPAAGFGSRPFPRRTGYRLKAGLAISGHSQGCPPSLAGHSKRENMARHSSETFLHKLPRQLIQLPQIGFHGVRVTCLHLPQQRQAVSARDLLPNAEARVKLRRIRHVKDV